MADNVSSNDERQRNLPSLDSSHDEREPYVPPLNEIDLQIVLTQSLKPHKQRRASLIT